MAWYDTALVSACATLIAAAAATFFAVSQIQNQRRIARTRATLDVIVKFESDDFYQSAVAAFQAFHAGKLTLEEVVDPPSEKVRNQARQMNAFLNFQETMALGIRHGALDRALFIDWWAATYVTIWNTMIPLTRRQRERTPRALVEFEALARAFAKERGLAFEEVHAASPKA